MKKITGISLFIYFSVVTAILTAGLVFYQNNKDTAGSTNTIAKNDVQKLISSGVSILSIDEISKHNSTSDCWIVINNKVYDITSYFGKHPGGSGTMSATCGKDATAAYKTKDPNATNSGSGTAHSSNAVNLLDNYFIGNLNQTIDQNTINANIQKVKSNIVPVSTENEYEDD